MSKYISLIAIAIVLFSCKKNDEYPKGNAQAQLNGNDWEAERAYANPSRFSKSNLIEIYIVKNPNADVSQHLAFGNVEKTLVRQPMVQMVGNVDTPEKLWTSFIISQDYDVTGDEYDLVESDTANNWLQITSADADFTKNIKGTFSATYYKAYSYPGSPNPDTIRIRNGSFYISKLKQF